MDKEIHSFSDFAVEEQALEGDKVKIEMSPYDLTKGRITWRAKN